MKTIHAPELKDCTRTMIELFNAARINASTIGFKTLFEVLPRSQLKLEEDQIKVLASRAITFNKDSFISIGTEMVKLKCGRVDIHLPKVFFGKCESSPRKIRLDFSEGVSSQMTYERIKVGKLFMFWKVHSIEASDQNIVLNLGNANVKYVVTF